MLRGERNSRFIRERNMPRVKEVIAASQLIIVVSRDEVFMYCTVHTVNFKSSINVLNFNQSLGKRSNSHSMQDSLDPDSSHRTSQEQAHGACFLNSEAHVETADLHRRMASDSSSRDMSNNNTKIRFTLSVASHSAGSTKKKYIAETFRQHDDGDDAELAKKRRMESWTIETQPQMADEADDNQSSSSASSSSASVNISPTRGSDAAYVPESTSTSNGHLNTPKHTETSTVDTTNPDESISTQEHDKINQQNGWRVKLYRLNADGSWDDCGTGRILCICTNNNTAPVPLRDSISSSEQQEAKTNDPSILSSNAGAWKAFDRIPQHATLTQQQQQRLSAALDEAIYRDLGNPILFMHAEMTSAHMPDTSTRSQYAPRILLRARVLLWETYQRQGDSIITWCEPAPAEPTSNQQQECRTNNQIHRHHRESIRVHQHQSSLQDESCSYHGVSTNFFTYINRPTYG